VRSGKWVYAGLGLELVSGMRTGSFPEPVQKAGIILQRIECRVLITRGSTTLVEFRGLGEDSSLCSVHCTSSRYKKRDRDKMQHRCSHAGIWNRNGVYRYQKMQSPPNTSAGESSPRFRPCVRDHQPPHCGRHPHHHLELRRACASGLRTCRNNSPPHHPTSQTRFDACQRPGPGRTRSRGSCLSLRERKDCGDAQHEVLHGAHRAR